MRAILFDAGDILYFRPERGRKFQAFLNKLGLTDVKISQSKLNSLKRKAFHGSISQDQHRQAILSLYGVYDPEEMQTRQTSLGRR